MEKSGLFNQVTNELPPYPMEELKAIKRSLLAEDKAVYDFGVGDPTLPVDPSIIEALREAVTPISQYPSVRGIDSLNEAYRAYLQRRFDLSPEESISVAPTKGSKEAVFHIMLALVGRAGGKKIVIYPDPSYPIYRSGTLFAGGTPYPVKLNPDNGYLLEPWNLPEFVQKDACALWINYPHNPTGACADRDYLKRVVEWARETKTVLLSDECYADIYPVELEDSPEQLPPTVLEFGGQNTLVFHSLSKRSGMTGYRSGMMAGDPELIEPYLKARANFGVAVPEFIQHASVVAWQDDEHVKERRRIFGERLHLLSSALIELGMLDQAPAATFYVWASVPEKWKGDDVKFAKQLAKQGVMVSPSQWLSEDVKGYVRFSAVPDLDETNAAVEILKKIVPSS